MAYEKIKISLNDGIAVISLADPATMNAAGLDTMAELRAAFAAYARPESGARCVILTGEGRGFCSGANLSGGGSAAQSANPDPEGPDSGSALETVYNPFMPSLRDYPIPIVTAINGAVAGVGCSIALMGDIIVAEGPIGRTNKGEVCVWADALSLGAKSLAPPPEKWHGLSDPELRYRRRYVDMYANPETAKVFAMRARIVSRIRRFMDARGYLEVETPVLQPIAGGAAARPFTTHHNALDMRLFMRIAPELYLKRCLVGGMRKVYEINRNYRNEGIDRSHNPEFTAMEVYEAFGDYGTMMELTESLIHELAVSMVEERRAAGLRAEEFRGGESGPVLPWGDLPIDYAKPFVRAKFEDLFRRGAGCEMRDFKAVRAKARELGLHHEAKLDDWLVVNEVFEHCAEPLIDPCRPTFVTDYPSAISPLTRPHRDDPVLCGRWDIFIGGMEIGPAYTELNDPDIQLAKFTEQLKGADDEESTFRTLDEDFIDALRVGMPPAGGLGIGIDRLVMLLTDSASIRDVILFPLLRSMAHGGGVDGAAPGAEPAR